MAKSKTKNETPPPPKSFETWEKIEGSVPTTSELNPPPKPKK